MHVHVIVTVIKRYVGQELFVIIVAHMDIGNISGAVLNIVVRHIVFAIGMRIILTYV